jgi:flagellar biosynthesis protein FliP
MFRKICFLIMILFSFGVKAETNSGIANISGFSGIAEPLQIVFGLSALSLIPLLLIATTCFTRFIIVFSMLRFALGLQQTPPNVVLISLSVFLSIFVMSPTLTKIENTAVSPLVSGEINEIQALASAKIASSQFMISQTREEDLSLVYRLSNTEMPTKFEDVEFIKLVPAYLLSELRTAFKIAFVIFLPFLMVDLIVSSILMSLGMIMVPPTTISLPIKVMLFVVLDGWVLITESLVSSVLA